MTSPLRSSFPLRGRARLVGLAVATGSVGLILLGMVLPGGDPPRYRGPDACPLVQEADVDLLTSGTRSALMIGPLETDYTSTRTVERSAGRARYRSKRSAKIGTVCTWAWEPPSGSLENTTLDVLIVQGPRPVRLTNSVPLDGTINEIDGLGQLGELADGARFTDEQHLMHCEIGSAENDLFLGFVWRGTTLDCDELVRVALRVGQRFSAATKHDASRA